MEKNKSGQTFMERLAALIVDRRTIIFFIVIGLSLFSVFSRNWVKVCDDITAYLPADTETRQGLNIMESNFTTYGTAKIMVENITLIKAEDLVERIKKLEGVKSVDFNPDRHYKDASVYFVVTFEGQKNDQISIDGLANVNELLEKYDKSIDSDVGNPLKQIIKGEMLIVDAIAVVIVVTVLLLTSSTYAEIPVLLLTFGAAAILNMGTNFVFGEISFVTNSIAIVLQLALAIDYAIILLHHYQEQHEKKAAREAVIAALSKSIPEIAGSSLTTIAGLAAMCLMRFRLGPDMGLVLIKAIFLSLMSVFFLMPGLLILFANWMDKSKHKNFVVKISFVGKFDYATRFIMPLLFVAILIGGFVLQKKANFVYSQNSVKSLQQNEFQIAKAKIKEKFGNVNQFAIVVPSGNYEKEGQIIREIETLEQTTKVQGLANHEAINGYMVTDALTPRQFSEMTGVDYEVAEGLYFAYSVKKNEYGNALTDMRNYKVPVISMFDFLLEKKDEISLNLDKDTEKTLSNLRISLNEGKAQLMNNGWSRIVVESYVPDEGEESFRYLDVLHGIVSKYYDTSYVLGETTSSKDLRTSFEKDNNLINILNILFVILVLIFTFKSVGLPILLIVIIQGAIWVNFSTPYLRGDNLFFLTNLIVSSIQMGANIDYAIVISSRYLELKEKMPLKDAMIETLNFAFPTIITSGTMLAAAGFAIYLITSNETISTIGLYLGQGTLISIALVMFVLPQILLLGDIIIKNTSFDIGLSEKVVRKTGLIRVDGRVTGNLNGFIDAEIHGLFRGELKGIVNVENIDVIEQNAADLKESATKEEKNED